MHLVVPSRRQGPHAITVNVRSVHVSGVSPVSPRQAGWQAGRQFGGPFRAERAVRNAQERYVGAEGKNVDTNIADTTSGMRSGKGGMGMNVASVGSD